MLHVASPMTHYTLAELPGAQALPLQTPMVFEPAEPARWAYHVLSVDLREAGPLGEEQLTELGADGWLLAGIVQIPVGQSARLTYYFVRAA